MANPSSNKSTQKSYNHLADNYEGSWHRYLSHTHEVFLSHLKTDKNDIILDLSCGTGMLASYLVNRNYNFDRLVLNDISENMLSIARRRLKGVSGIEFSNHAVSELPFKDNSFTKILCLSAFHNYPDPASVIQEIRRILRFDGELFLLDWNNSGFFKVINFLINHSTREVINTRSLQEAIHTFNNHSFSISGEQEWYWGYWKLFYFKATK